jgi:hypothetical protein
MLCICFSHLLQGRIAMALILVLHKELAHINNHAMDLLLERKRDFSIREVCGKSSLEVRDIEYHFSHTR